MKDPELCKKCKYKTTDYTFENRYKHRCNFLFITGQSRLVIEMANGGVKTDSCICLVERTK